MIRRPPRSTQSRSSAASDVYKRQQHLRQDSEIGGHACKARAALAPPFVHVDRAVEFELDGMQAGGRIAVMLGDEAAGIGLVPAHGVAQAAQGLFHGLGPVSYTHLRA